jgi:hypothetical protein
MELSNKLPLLNDRHGTNAAQNEILEWKEKFLPESTVQSGDVYSKRTSGSNRRIMHMCGRFIGFKNKIHRSIEQALRWSVELFTEPNIHENDTFGMPRIPDQKQM